MTDYDVNQLKSSCFTAIVFMSVAAVALGLMFHLVNA